MCLGRQHTLAGHPSASSTTTGETEEEVEDLVGDSIVRQIDTRLNKGLCKVKQI